MPVSNGMKQLVYTGRRFSYSIFIRIKTDGTVQGLNEEARERSISHFRDCGRAYANTDSRYRGQLIGGLCLPTTKDLAGQPIDQGSKKWRTLAHLFSQDIDNRSRKLGEPEHNRVKHAPRVI